MKTLLKCFTALGITFIIATLLDASAKREHERKMAELELEREKLARSDATNLGIPPNYEPETKRSFYIGAQGELLVTDHDAGLTYSALTGKPVATAPGKEQEPTAEVAQQEKPRSLLEPAWQPGPKKPGNGKPPASFA